MPASIACQRTNSTRAMDIANGAHDPYAHSAVPAAYRTALRSPTSPAETFPAIEGGNGSYEFRYYDPETAHTAATLVANDPTLDAMYYKPPTHGRRPLVTPYDVSQVAGRSPVHAAHQYNCWTDYHQHPFHQQVGMDVQQRIDYEDANTLPAPRAHLVPQPSYVSGGQSSNLTEKESKKELHRQPIQAPAPVEAQQQRRAQQPSQQRRSSQQPAQDGPFHTPLEGRCEFHRVPENLSTPAHWPALEYRRVDTDGSTVRAFVGQVRFETTAEQIAYIIEYVSSVVPAYVSYHRNGCFVVHFYSWDDCRAALGYHQTIYCDIGGVWIAHDDAGLDAMNTEIQSVAQGPRKARFRRCRLPGRAMVIEAFTDDRLRAPQVGPGSQSPSFHGHSRVPSTASERDYSSSQQYSDRESSTILNDSYR